MSNVVDLSQSFAMSRPAANLLKRAKAIGLVADQITMVLSQLPHEEQRFLTAIIGWRIEGGMALPASDLLSKLPSLHGLEFGSIQAISERLVENEVIEFVEVEKDAQGITTAGGFVWPALERLLLVGEDRAKTPVLTDLDGKPLR
ncbi:MAG: hypothetical protein V4641_05495 [Pseudomonadota bacterium]